MKLDVLMKRRKLNLFEMFILCLMRLHLGMAVENLANRFQICKSTVSKAFLLVLDVQDCVKLWPIITWPEGSELIAIPYIERPTNLTARSLTWSYYASSNTVKYWHNTTWHNTLYFERLGWTYKLSTCDRKFWLFEIFNLCWHSNSKLLV